MANVSKSAEPLLPVDKAAERPLWIVLTVMAFIAALALLSQRMGDRHYDRLQSDLAGTATVQLTELTPEGRIDTAQRVLEIIRTSYPDITAARISDSDALSLIEPWMGDSLSTDLPDGITLPVLITLSDSLPTQRTALTAELKAQNISAVIDDHSEWTSDISRAARAFSMSSWLILLLTFFAGTAASIFATQSAMAAQAKTVSVFAQVGAADKFIMRLFVWRSVKVAALSAITGSAGALLFLGLFRLLRGTSEGGAFANITPSLFDIVMLLALCLIFAVVCAVAAGASANRILNNTRLYQ